MNYLVAADDWFSDTPGGMARVALDVALLMRDRGHQVTYLCARPNQDCRAPSDEEIDDIRVVRYDRPVLPAWHPRRADRLIEAAAGTARARLTDQKWDVVHIHSPCTGEGALRGIASWGRLLYTMHSPLVMEQEVNWRRQGFVGLVKLTLGRGKLKRLEKGLLRRCDAIQTLSRFTREQIERFYGLGSRVTVIPHWPSPAGERIHSKAEARCLLGWPANERILFTVRRHGVRYGLDIAIEAIAPLAARGQCVFIVGGDGPMRPALEKLAAQLGSGDRVRFPGRLSDEHLRLAYEAADLFVLPTLALECFGLIIIEAFSFGCPVVSTDVGAIPEAMQPILPQFIVPAGDVPALRRKVDDFLNQRITVPSADELTDYVNKTFGKGAVIPQIISFIEGKSSACAASPG